MALMPQQKTIDEQSLDKILDVIGALVIILDTEGRIVRFNQACETLTGYREDEAVGRLVWDLLVADDEVEAGEERAESLGRGGFHGSSIA